MTEYEKIRYAFEIEGKSRRQIGRDLKHSYWTIRKALESAEPKPYQLNKPKSAPKIDPFKERIAEMLAGESALPKKQRYTSRRIYEVLVEEGYEGSESYLRHYICRVRSANRRPPIFIPLTYAPGEAAQVDWGEADVLMGGEQVTVQLFVMRMMHSRRTFVMAFPRQKWACFAAGHVAAFDFFGGVPKTVIYDNLKTAVATLTGRDRSLQPKFVGLRSHYLFESRFCTPGAGHEKGGVEHGVKFVRKRYLVPLPQVSDFAELNAFLREKCEAEDGRTVARQKATIGEMFGEERLQLRPLPAVPFDCATSREATLTRYSQVTCETNRYSVPADKATKTLTLKLYPFRIDIIRDNAIIATHDRCYGREQDIIEPTHYLPLLAERPGAFDHAKPIQQWKTTWPPVFDRLLRHFQAQMSSIVAIKTFVRILQMVVETDSTHVATAIERAFDDGIVSEAGIRFCLNRLCDPAQNIPIETADEQPAVPDYDRLLPHRLLEVTR